MKTDASRLFGDMRLLVLLLLGLPLTAQLSILNVTTGAGYLPGITRPGGISTVFVSGLTRPNDGVRVTVFGVAAPVLSVSDLGPYQQINFVVPNLPDLVRTPVTIGVSQSGNVTSIKLRDGLFSGYPADLFRDADGFGVAQHAADSSRVTRQSPARGGELVVIYATGMGAVEPPVASGAPALILYPGETDGLKVFVCQSGPSCAQNGQRHFATAVFAGLSSGSPGVYQINFRIPDNAPSGDLEFGVYRTYCYDAPCTLMSPFSEVFESARVKLPIQ